MNFALLSALALLAQQAPDDAPTQPVERPRDVTEQTRNDAVALAALERRGEVLFRDDFESEASLAKWFEIRGLKEGRVRLVSGDGVAAAGRGAIELEAPANDGRSSGAGASAWLGKEGHDCVYFRRYLRFADDYDQGNLNHTGGGLAAVAGTGMWDEMGKAGVRPTGDDRFTCAFEPWREWGKREAPGCMFLYVYWPDMERDRDGNWWGNMFMPDEEHRIVPPRGKWVCLEQMVRANRPGDHDGEAAAWIDGALYLHLTGIRWRTSELVRVKRFDIEIYVHQARRTNTVRYDEVVVSTGYVGPISEVTAPDASERDGARER